MMKNQCKVDIDQTFDDKFVVVINTSGEHDGWSDFSEKFETREEAVEWLKKIKQEFRFQYI